MELTRYERAVKSALDELGLINGRLSVLNSFVTQTKTRIETDARVGHQLITVALSMRDVTLNKDTSNLFLADDHYKLDRSNLTAEVDMILSRECLFQISQAYEILETYLYDQVAELIHQTSNFILFVEQKTDTSSFTSIRKALKTFNDRKNNRHLISILKANCKVFADNDKGNVYNFDFSDWYEMLGEVRHCITHLRTEVTPSVRDVLPISYKAYFKTVPYGGLSVMFITFQECSELLSRIADFIFLVFKAVSERTSDVLINFDTIHHFMPDIYYGMLARSKNK